MRFQDLKDRVVVITGASSGIGKLAVEEFLKRGAKVVLAARSIDEMQEHLMELNVDDRHALVVKTDVAEFQDVSNLAEKTLEHFGQIDIWVNNAAVSLYGLLDELEPEEMGRIIDVNLKGSMYGSKVAIQIFKQQGYGNLVNVASVLGKIPAPLQGAYTATKHAVVGFTGALREELISGNFKDIGVSMVLPASMDTPLFAHAKSRAGIQPLPIPPVYDPMVSVRAIIKCAQNGTRQVIAGNAGRQMVFAGKLFPRLIEQYMGKVAMRQQQAEIPKPIEGDDNLYQPMHGTQHIRGGWGTTGEHIREYAQYHPAKASLAVALPLALLGFFALRRRMA